ncbi:hypothetical protein JYU34_000319 [Plutella xylostella]|uniref:Uncharacterized protein n=1 Tax=Plutella xylostella TaxID=51655 RepID=A0ABQ7R7E5_PLUXY|nr:hypothetical protein JYU34_000319 [Plutella xylostella]
MSLSRKPEEIILEFKRSLDELKAKVTAIEMKVCEQNSVLANQFNMMARLSSLTGVKPAKAVKNPGPGTFTLQRPPQRVRTITEVNMAPAVSSRPSSPAGPPPPRRLEKLMEEGKEEEVTTVIRQGPNYAADWHVLAHPLPDDQMPRVRPRDQQ